MEKSISHLPASILTTSRLRLLQHLAVRISQKPRYFDTRPDRNTLARQCETKTGRRKTSRLLAQKNTFAFSVAKKPPQHTTSKPYPKKSAKICVIRGQKKTPPPYPTTSRPIFITTNNGKSSKNASAPQPPPTSNTAITPTTLMPSPYAPYQKNDGNGDQHFFLQDANFNVTAIVDETGTVEERYSYTPYGKVTVLEPNYSPDPDNKSDVNNEILYTGRRRDPETNLQLNRNRFYASHLGRWINRDPIGYLGWNESL